MNNFTSISIRLATPEDADLPRFDNTKLVALDTCVRYGIITYQMHKVMSNYKVTALDAGVALHQVFAGIRLWQLYYYDLEGNIHAKEITQNHGRRLFGKDRWDIILEPKFFGPNAWEERISFCLAILDTSGFEPDEDDKKRSANALEEVAVNYLNKYDMQRYPIWIRDVNDPTTDVGIEIGYDLVVSFEYFEKALFEIGDCSKAYETKSYRFIGKLDGIHIDPDITNPDATQGALFVADNKTTSRIMSDYSYYDMDTQFRGYMLAARVFTGHADINHAKVILSSVPVPAKSTHGGQYIHPVYQPDYMLERWFDWFYNLVQKEQEFENMPFDAPESPHSCHRYFRNCSLLPFCTASRQEQEEAINEMETKEWNVLAEENDD